MTGNEILIGLGTNLATACAQEVFSRLYDKRAAAGAEAEEWRQRAKTLEVRVIERFLEAARKLPQPPRQVETLRLVLGDPVFVSEIAAALIAGHLTANRFEATLRQQNTRLGDDQTLQDFAAAFTETFNAAVAADTELTLLIELRRSGQLQRGIENISSSVHEVQQGVYDLTVRTVDEHHRTRNEIRELRTVVEALRPEPRLAVLESPDAARLKKSTKRRFDKAVEELKTGSAEAAARDFRSLLQDLRPDDPDDENLIFRVTSNLGVALHYMGDTDGACEAFDKAYETNPDSIRAKSNKVLAHLTRNDYPAAEHILDEALRVAPTDIDLINFKAQILGHRGDDFGAARFLEQHRISDENFLVALSIYYNRAGEHAKAAHAARDALRINPNSESGMAVLADALAMPIVFRKSEQKLPGYALSKAELEDLREAVRLDKTAAAILRRTQHRVSLVQLLINLSAYAAAAGDFYGAEAAASEALHIAPNDSAGLANLYLAQMHLDKFSEAAKTARALVRFEDPAIATMREMDALMAQRDFPGVVCLYNERCKTVPAILDHAHTACLNALAMFSLFDTQGAILKLDDAARRFPNHPLVLLEQAHIYEQLKNYKQAEECLNGAVAHAVGPYAFHARQQLGLFHYRRGNWVEAEKHVLADVEDPLVSPFLIPYLICLYNLGRYGECVALAQQVVSTGRFNETVWELATNCYLNFKDLEPAERLLEQLVRQSDDLRHWLKLFQVAFRLHDVQQARNVLERAFVKHPDSFYVIVNLSGVEFTTGNHRRAFELATRAVDLQPDNLEAHRAVVRSGLFAPDTEKFSGTEKLRIQQSIAVLAGQEDGGLKPIQVEEDLASITEILRQASEAAGKAEELFSTKLLPMAFLSHVLGKSTFTIWAGLTTHDRLHVPMASGSQAEQDAERILATESTEVVVDVSALFTLRALQMLDLLPLVFPKIYIATAAFESIKQELDEMNACKAPTAIMGFKDGRVVMVEVPPERHETRKAFLSDIMNFLKSGAVSVSGLDGTVWNDDLIRKSAAAIGESAGHSIAVAKARKVPLYSDDLGIRMLSKNEHRVNGFCTQALLRSGVGKNKLNADAYHDAVLSLLEHNYHFVSESADTVVRALQKAKYAFTPLTTRLVSRFSEAGINRTGSAVLLGPSIIDLWLRAGRQQREEWLDFIAQKLGALQDCADICAALIRGIAVAALRLPAVFFGLCRHLTSSKHFSPEQRAILTLFYNAAARAVVSACSVAFPGDQQLECEWHEHLRWSGITRVPQLLEGRRRGELGSA